MIKFCPVIKNNAAITVFDFDGMIVQVPAIGRKADRVNVKFEDGKYEVVADDYKEAPVKEEAPKKEKNKKTTKNEYENFEDALADGEVE